MRTIQNLNEGWEFALQRNGEELTYAPVILPHDWAVSSPMNRAMEQGDQQGFLDRWGIGWYRRKLRVEKKDDMLYFLCFDGIYENSTVWVNDCKAGGRKYGYSSFSLDITAVLADGENDILVKVDNTQVPVDRWYSGAGIYRKVYLLSVPKLHLQEENVKLETAVDGRDGILRIMCGTEEPVRAILKKDGNFYEAVSTLRERDGVSESGIEIRVQNAKLWYASDPVLYDLTLQLEKEGQVTDEITFKVGFREALLTPDRGLFINGTPTKLKGVCVHQEAGVWGTAVTEEVWRERLMELKKIGCNALRLAHHIFMPEMLDLCDELGFYVYEECFDKWTGGAYGRYYETEWEKDLTCMVKRDRNHPCILFWGVGNEVENQAYASMLALLESHVSKIKEYDASRPVSIAMNPHFAYPGQETDMTRVKDIQQFVDEMKSGEIFDMDERVDQIRLIAEKVDFLSCNYQEQWYDRIHAAIPDKAILGTETYMYFRGYEEKLQNFSDRIPWFDVEERDYCIGGMIWTGIDYLGESMGYPAKGWSGALFADDMEKKPMAWLYQSYWTKEPVIHFAVMDYSIPDEGVKEHWDSPRYVTHWDFPQFTKVVIPYMVATNCEQVEIWVNDKEFLLQPTAAYPNRMITGFLPYLPGTVTVIGKNGGEEVCRHVVKTSRIAVRLAFDVEEQEIVCSQHGDGIMPYQILRKVRAYDSENTPVFRESAKVQFCVEGPAEIVGVENGDMKSWEPVSSNLIHLYQGRADVAVRITGTGRVRITAFAAGMEMAQAVIHAVADERKNL